jgi:4-hydroxy-3-methylbut-2-en-1-yl diphosphate reductase
MLYVWMAARISLPNRGKHLPSLLTHHRESVSMKAYGGSLFSKRAKEEVATKLRKLLLAKPRGFCAGVDRAIDVVNMALELFAPPVYVRREIVHNKHVIQTLAAKGAVFVDEIEQVPAGALVIFSAHGVSPEVRTQAAAKHLRVIDATCPLVTKVHTEAVRFAKEGRSIILVGHAGHDEIIGTMGEAPDSTQLVSSVEEAERVQVSNPEQVAVTTQTTLGVDDAREILEVLRRRFPKIVTPSSDDICYATQNRQMAVKLLAKEASVILVLGSENSSNSRRLREVAEMSGVRAFLIEDATKIDPAWLDNVECVGITAGASAPEHLVQDVIAFFRARGVEEIEEIEAVVEKVTFTPPPELARAMAKEESTSREVEQSRS